MVVSTGFESFKTENSLITENNKAEKLLMKLDNKTDDSLIIASNTDNLLLRTNKAIIHCW